MWTCKGRIPRRKSAIAKRLMDKALGCRFGYPGNWANPGDAALSGLRLILEELCYPT